MQYSLEVSAADKQRSDEWFSLTEPINPGSYFTYVSDVIEVLIKASRSKLKNEILNVGSGRTVSILNIVKLLKGDKVHIKKRPGEPDCTFADITKIKKKLNWRPKIKIEKGIKLLLDNLDYWKKAPVWTPKKINKATKLWFKYLGK